MGSEDVAARRRYRRILRFAGTQLAVTWWFELFLPRIGLNVIAKKRRAERLHRFARRFHDLAIDLGGLMIKVGQFMSSRLDVLPPEITKELEGLQDEVPPVPFPLIRAAAEAELGMPLSRAFDWFDDKPVAAASLGQAHRARLIPLDVAEVGFADVIVKVQRPGIDAIVTVDLAALRRVARWLSRVRIVADRVDAPALVEEFATTSLEEIDYINEAANAERFASDVAEDSRVRVPAVVWERTSRRVLTLEDVTAIKISDTAALREAGIDPAHVAAVFADQMFDQLFTHGFFHADPHPGNIFVTPAVEGAHLPWTLTFIDFGMMGEVPEKTRQSLRKLLIAASGRDGKALVEAMSGVGMLLPSARTSDLQRAFTELFARFGGMGFAQLREVDAREFRDFAAEFGDVIRSLPFQLPENFLLIIRAMSLVSGVCSTLQPDFNLWDSAEPYAARLVRTEGTHLIRDALSQMTDQVKLIAHLPSKLDDLLSRIDDGTVSVASNNLEDRVTRLERVAWRILAAVIFAALLIGGVLLDPTAPGWGVTLMIVSVIPLAVALIPRGRRRRRR